MAALITPSLRAALERLKHGGAVNGLLLGWRRQVLLNLLPFEDFRAERLLQSVHDAQAHFSSNGDRWVETYWFGYDTCHVLVCLHQECTLVILHSRAEEVDFLRGAAETFLEDSQLLLNSILYPQSESGEDTQPLDQNEAEAHRTQTNFISRAL